MNHPEKRLKDVTISEEKDFLGSFKAVVPCLNPDRMTRKNSENIKIAIAIIASIAMLAILSFYSKPRSCLNFSRCVVIALTTSRTLSLSSG